MPNENPEAEVPHADWLDDAETETWLQVWSMMTWLPARLDAQLKADADLSLAEYNVLSQLSMAPGRRMRLSDLSDVTNTTLSHLSRVASRMERQGWLERQPDPTDGRTTFAQLTAPGLAVVESAAAGHVATVRRYVFDPLTTEQSADLGRAAARIVEAVAPTRVARVRRSTDQPGEGT